MSEGNLGRASAGAAGLNRLVTGKRFLHTLSGDHASLPLWDFAISFGRNGSTVFNGLFLAARTQLLR